MNRRHSLLAGLLMLGATNAQSMPGLSDPPAGATLPSAANPPAPSKQGPVTKDFSHLPLAFERNQGQTNSHVRFLTHSGNSTLFLTPSEAIFSMAAHAPKQKKSARHKGKNFQHEQIPQVTLRMQMVGANPKATVMQQHPLKGKVNYFIGNDPSKWQRGIPTYGRVGFQGIYPGVDLVYYGNQEHLEYDFVVAPHADPKNIKLHFDGAQKVKVNTAGELIVRTAERELKWQKPTVYQQDKNGKHAVAANFRLKKLPNGKSGVSFALGHYDTSRPLVIDPVLSYSTYLGGSAIIGRGDYTTAIAVDDTGAAYVTGNAYSTNFPIVSGPTGLPPLYEDINQATQVINEINSSHACGFITKINAAGTGIEYSTFLGGGTRDSGEAIAVDGAGNAYIAGETSSANYPVTYGAFQTVKLSSAGADTVVVTAISSDGSQLLYSTFWGGTSQDEAFAIAVEDDGTVYFAGDASSTDFPIGTSVAQGAFQTRLQASQGQTAFVSKLDPAGNPVYSTYLGGEYQDQASGIAIDATGNAYVTGWTNSGKFPTTTNAFQKTAPQTSRSSSSAYVSKLNPNGTGLVYSTYLGGTTGFGDFGYGIKVDKAGSAYVTGAASSFDFPTSTGAFQTVNRRTVSYTSFVTKLNPAGSALAYSTYLGGSNSPQGTAGDIGFGIAIDSQGYAYVAGETTNTDFPTTVGSYQRISPYYGSAAFLTKINKTGTALIYSTLVSGQGGDPTVAGDIAYGVAVDLVGNAYITGSTTAPDFPTTRNVFQTRFAAASGGANSFVTKISPVQIFPDFNNDGSTDLFLQNSTTAALSSWFMQGAIRTGTASFSLTPPTEYALVGAGDFFADGSTTLVLQSSVTNKIAFWYTSGTNLATIPGGNFVTATPPTGWKVVAVADFNSDGKSDLVFQNQTTGQISIWFMNGYLYNGGVQLPVTPLSGWKIVGTGDFNADGFKDFVFQNQTTNQIALWYMTGTTYAGGTVLTTVPAAGYKVVGVLDLSGDGAPDLLFQSSASNKLAVWYIQNSAFVGGDTIQASVPSGVKVAGPR